MSDTGEGSSPTPPQYPGSPSSPGAGPSGPSPSSGVTTGPAPKRSADRGRLLVLGSLLAAVVALAIVAAYLVGRGENGDDATPPTTQAIGTEPTSGTIDDSPTSDTSDVSDPLPTVADLARSTVMLVMVDTAGDPLCSGSGTIVDTDGTILTNAHVVLNDDSCPYVAVRVAVTDDADVPPTVLYEADLLVIDEFLDLAVVRIARDLDGSVVEDVFTPTRIGDSDSVQIGDSLRILGYPAIGGATITFTVGTVSGFTSQAGEGERSWIKTDATIAGGNSGGTAVNDAGELIGIPTQGGADDDSPVVDCRVLTDTNGDGVTDENDQCVPFGGFLNGIRPVNLAAEVLIEARTASPLPIEWQSSTPDADLSDAYFYHPRFSIGVPTDDTSATTDFVLTAGAGETELCFWFDWYGMPVGAVWDATWLVDGEVVEAYSFFGEIWQSDPDGLDYWVCATNEDGFVAGLYEIAFQVEGETMFIEGLEVTLTPVAIHVITIVNDTDVEGCYLMVNPASSSDVGLDVLASDEFLPAGASVDIEVPEGEQAIYAYDCDGGSLGGVDPYTVTGPATIRLSEG